MWCEDQPIDGNVSKTNKNKIKMLFVSPVLQTKYINQLKTKDTVQLNQIHNHFGKLINIFYTK